MMIVSAMPMMKPLITGSEMKFDRNPRRTSPASSARTPVTTASAVVRATKSSVPAAANAAIAVADRAAVADIGPVTRCLELPNAA